LSSDHQLNTLRGARDLRFGAAQARAASRFALLAASAASASQRSWPRSPQCPPYGEIRWLKLSRLSDEEMKTLMIDVANKTYQVLALLFDDRLGDELVQYLARQDPLPRWNEPILS
jgi:hypothetical protein